MPSWRCAGLNESLAEYGIAANANQRLKGGENLVLFYEKDLGLYPKVEPITGRLINGGIPQRVNISLHLELVRRQIRTAMPDVGFTGAAVIDWESWRPVWGGNWGKQRVYKTLSLSEAGERWPNATRRELKVKARRRWNKAAK